MRHASPVLRAAVRRSLRIALRQRGVPLLELRRDAITDDCGLAKAPSREPYGRDAKYAALSVLGHPLRAPGDDDLPLDRVPREHHADPRGSRDLPALARCVVRVDGEAALVDVLEQHDPGAGSGAGVGGAEDHRVRLDDARSRTSANQRMNCAIRVGSQIRLGQRGPEVAAAQVRQVGSMHVRVVTRVATTRGRRG